MIGWKMMPPAPDSEMMNRAADAMRELPSGNLQQVFCRAYAAAFEAAPGGDKEIEREILERAFGRMGWPEIHAYQAELRKGQDIYEDAGGFIMRAIRRLFGLPSPYSEVTTYQQAARAMIKKAEAGEAP